MPKINTDVDLNPQEQALAKHLAKRRYSNNRASGVRNARRGGQSDAETGLEGGRRPESGPASAPLAVS
jgi:hypothetical protein